MLEVTHSCRDFLPEDNALGEHSKDNKLRNRAFRLCRDYLRGSWLSIQPEDMVLRKISGGLSNLLYYCALPEGVEPSAGEPGRLLLRLYGNTNQERAMETLITESVIFTLLSESQRGPRLYGVFPGGRLEEYIEARALQTQELANSTLSSIIADKLAQIHLMDVPIDKQPRKIWQTMEGWLKHIQECLTNRSFPENSEEMMNTLEQLNLYEEFIWLKDYLMSVKSPVVFCHNDLQEGNILLRNTQNVKSLKKKASNGSMEIDFQNMSSENIVIIDFEYCSYNYRGFDFANHFCEWIYDYSKEDPPYFWEIESNRPDSEQKNHFFNSYLKALKNYPEYKPRPEDNLESLIKETEAFTLASHFFWGLWSVVYSACTEIRFDYWGYGEARFQAYYRHKKNMFGENN